MKDKDLKQFVEKYGDDVCNAILKLSDGEECSNEFEKSVLAEIEGGEVGRFIDAYGEELFDDLYEFMKRKASMESNRTPYKKGDFIGQKYEVHDVLGMGGFGIVYLVISHETGDVYALKTFRDEYLEDSQTRERFKKEAHIWIDLERHAYIVRAFFVDEISGRLFIATEYIAPSDSNEGLNTLDAFLRRRPPGLAQSLRWSIQFCHGMEYAYSKGIRAHRDIKPANIMIGQDKVLKITDFGLAGIIGNARISGIKLGFHNDKVGLSCQTMEGSGFGTPTHMPPEQFTNAAACDERSDIYSFGVVLYQMATGGSLPFLPNLPKNEGEHQRFWHDMHRLHSQAAVPKLNSPLFPIIQKCLVKDPKRRYRSFKDLRADIEPLLKGLTGEVVKLPDQIELAVWEWKYKGFSLSTLGKKQEAIACYDKALEINPRDATAWSNKGSSLGDLGKNQEAIACYDKALEINPRDESAWSNKGVTLNDLGKYQEAITCYDKALEINPRLDTAWNNKGSSLQNLGKYHEAIACYEKALEINPRDAETWNNKGLSLADLGKYQAAIVCYDKAFEVNPQLGAAWNNKGNSLDDLGKYHEAIACYDKALEINPRDTSGWNNKGISLKSLGKYQEAIACYDKALEINPMYAETWYNKGISLRNLGKHQEAIAAYENFIKFAPAHYAEQVTAAKTLIQKLKQI